MLKIPDVVDRLIKVDRPVIFLDTCILLDVIRAIKRCQTNCIRSAAQLLSAATTEPVKCCVVVSQVVREEWGKNESTLLNEARTHLAEINKQSRLFHDACTVFGIVPGFPQANYAGLDLETRMHELSRKLLDCATEIDTDDECSGRAMYRVIKNLPSSKQGREAKDCLIVEQCLEVCRRLHAAEFTRKLVFCTSNTNDYCKIGSELHENLATELDSVGLQFTANLSGGFQDLTL